MPINQEILEEGKAVSITTLPEFEPKKYFQNREGLYVWSDFNDRIVAKTQSVEGQKDYALTSFTLKKAATDEEIEGASPSDHLFSETDVCSVIAALIDKQPKGKEGTLLNNGYANLFYTPEFVVGVIWDAGDGGWRVFTWRRRGDGWAGGLRVFSPATGS